MNPFNLDILLWPEVPVTQVVVVDEFTNAVAATLGDPEPANVARRAADFSIESAVAGYLQALRVPIPNKSGCGVAK